MSTFRYFIIFALIITIKHIAGFEYALLTIGMMILDQIVYVASELRNRRGR